VTTSDAEMSDLLPSKIASAAPEHAESFPISSASSVSSVSGGAISGGAISLASGTVSANSSVDELEQYKQSLLAELNARTKAAAAVANATQPSASNAKAKNDAINNFDFSIIKNMSINTVHQFAANTQSSKGIKVMVTTAAKKVSSVPVFAAGFVSESAKRTEPKTALTGSLTGAETRKTPRQDIKSNNCNGNRTFDRFDAIHRTYLENVFDFYCSFDFFISVCLS
jgi:hypothetical protein